MSVECRRLAAALEHRVDSHAADVVEHVMAGRRRAALRALADAQALDLTPVRAACAAWVHGQLTNPAEETDR